MKLHHLAAAGIAATALLVPATAHAATSPTAGIHGTITGTTLDIWADAPTDTTAKLAAYQFPSDWQAQKAAGIATPVPQALLAESPATPITTGHTTVTLDLSAFCGRVQVDAYVGDTLPEITATSKIGPRRIAATVVDLGACSTPSPEPTPTPTPTTEPNPPVIVTPAPEPSAAVLPTTSASSGPAPVRVTAAEPTIPTRVEAGNGGQAAGYTQGDVWRGTAWGAGMGFLAGVLYVIGMNWVRNRARAERAGRRR